MQHLIKCYVVDKYMYHCRKLVDSDDVKYMFGLIRNP